MRVVAVEDSTLKSVPALCIFSALIETAGGSFTPESAEDLASLIAGKSRVLAAGSLGDKAGHKVAAKASLVVVHKVDLVVARELGMADKIGVMPEHRKVRVISPHFFSN